MAAGANINGLIDPTVGVTPGPNYALTLNNNFDLIDGHDHSTGNGATLNLANIAINDNYSLSNYGLLNISKLQLIDASTLSITTNRSIYSKGDDLWFYNGNGLDIQITNASGIAAAAGNISGLVAPASASFSGSTFTFNSTATAPGNIEGGDLILHNSSSLTYKLTLKSPTLSSNVINTLPLPPAASTAFVTMDTSGVMATNISTNQGIVTSMIADGAVTYAKRSSLNIQTSPSCGIFSLTSGGPGPFWNDITNLSVTITTNGRPICLNIVPDGSANPCLTYVSNSGNFLKYLRNSTDLALFYINPPMVQLPFLFIDTPTSGTYTYKVQFHVSVDMNMNYFKLVAYEL
jgi:hypothetical protein